MDLKGITKLTPENLEKAVLLQQLVNKIRDDLKAKKLLADDDKSHRLDAPNVRLVRDLGDINQDNMLYIRE